MSRRKRNKKPLEQEGAALAPSQPQQSLDYFVEARNGRKRNYIYDFRKSTKCAHANLTALSLGGNWYRCKDCNWAFDIVAAYQQPLHNLVIGGLLNAMHFAKEFGGHALGEVLRRPIGQSDGSPHKPVLPEGMSFADAIATLEAVNVQSEDGGQAELKAILDSIWVGPKERLLADKKKQEALGEGNANAGEPDGGSGQPNGDARGAVSGLPQGEGQGHQDRDPRGS